MATFHVVGCDIFAAKKIMEKQINQMAVKYSSLIGGAGEGGKWERTLDKIFSPGCYFVEIAHADDSVGLPVEYCGEEHYIVGNLVVTDSGTQGPRQNNRMTGQVLIFTGRGSGETKICLRTYSGGAWGKWSELSRAGANKEITSTDDLVAAVQALVEDVDVLKGAGEGSVAAAVDKAFSSAVERINLNAQKIADIVAGNNIPAVAYDVYSLQGKSDVAEFAKRTVAGRASVQSGVATLKQIGGNAVKNLVDGTFAQGWQTISSGDAITLSGDCAVIKAGYAGSGVKCDLSTYPKHFYYCKALVFNLSGTSCLSLGDTELQLRKERGWEFVSWIGNLSGSLLEFTAVGGAAEFIVSGLLLVDLTEMYGSGFEPTAAECKAIYAHTGALKKGLTFAQPLCFGSVGYNQCDASKALINKTISGGAIGDGANYVVPFPCVPCAVGTGENNGYVISTGVNDYWSENSVKAVYYSPFNPVERVGNLYLEQLTPQLCTHCTGEHSVYVPSCPGYLLVETTSLNNICAHLVWSGDVDFRKYEKYKEAEINLPEIAAMSEWGLAGVSGYQGCICDTIDLENKKYIKRVGRVSLKSLSFYKNVVANLNWYAWKNADKVVYTNYTDGDLKNFVSQGSNVDVREGAGILFNKWGNISSVVTDTQNSNKVLSITINGVVYERDAVKDEFFGWFSCTKTVEMYLPANTQTLMSYVYSPIFSKDAAGYRALYTTGFNHCVSLDKNWSDSVSVSIYVRCDECTTGAEFESYIKSLPDEDAMLYYVLPEPEIYDISGDMAASIFASDYGTEEFVGSEIPLRENKIFYMRSLSNELRNLLDRLYAKYGTTDPVEVADRIASASA